MVLHAFVTRRIDYCNGLLYGLPDCEIAKLQRVQNASSCQEEISGTSSEVSKSSPQISR